MYPSHPFPGILFALIHPFALCTSGATTHLIESVHALVVVTLEEIPHSVESAKGLTTNYSGPDDLASLQTASGVGSQQLT